MKIKEVEERVGISSKNIRYYEEKGLLNPERDAQNNYRTYSEEDVRQLERIKTLRILGVSIESIRTLGENPQTMEQVMETRVKEIQKEKEELSELEKACNKILAEQTAYENLSTNCLNMESEIVKKSFWEVLKEDSMKEKMVNKCFVVDYALNLIILIGGIVFVVLLSCGMIKVSGSDFAIEIVIAVVLLLFTLWFLHYQRRYFKLCAEDLCYDSSYTIARMMAVSSIVNKCIVIFFLLFAYFARVGSIIDFFAW